MNSNFVSSIIGIALVLSIGTFVFMDNNDIPQVPSGLEDTSASEVGAEPVSSGMPVPTEGTVPEEMIVVEEPAVSDTPPAPGSIAMAEVASHNSRESCWSVINGNVYDLTSWVPKHPGGEQAILRICGTDGSAKYNGQHGGASKQEMILAGFKIGVLAS